MIRLQDKVTVRITKSAMSSKIIMTSLVVCGIELDEAGIEFYRGRTEAGKVRYFRKENIVII